VVRIRIEETNAAVLKCWNCGAEIALVPLDPLYEEYVNEYLDLDAPHVPEFQYWGRHLDRLRRVVCPKCGKTIAEEWYSIEENPVLRRLYTEIARTPSNDEYLADE